MFAAPSRSHVSAAGIRVALVVSAYHERITLALRDGAVDAFRQAGGDQNDLLVIGSPGAFELTAVCRALAVHGDVDGIVALGCILKGQTTHDQHLADAVANGLSSVTVHTGVPIAFGVLTCRTQAQARARAGGRKGNKGAEAMRAVIQTVHAIRRVRDQSATSSGRPAPIPAGVNGHVMSSPAPRRSRRKSSHRVKVR